MFTPPLEQILNLAQLRELARDVLPRGMFEYVDRGTEDEVLLRENRDAFERIRLRPRVLVDVSGRSAKVKLFGKELSLPMAVAPTGAAGLMHHNGEVEIARAAAKAGIPFSLSTYSINSMEQVADEAGLESALTRLLENPAEREALGQRAQSVVRENLGSIGRTVSMIMEVL